MPPDRLKEVVPKKFYAGNDSTASIVGDTEDNLQSSNRGSNARWTRSSPSPNSPIYKNKPSRGRTRAAALCTLCTNNRGFLIVY